MLDVPLSMTAPSYKQWDWHVHYFCEFGFFVNIKYLHNTKDNNLNEALLIYFIYTEKLTDRVLWNIQSIFNNIQPKFNG